MVKENINKMKIARTAQADKGSQNEVRELYEKATIITMKIYAKAST